MNISHRVSQNDMVAFSAFIFYMKSYILIDFILFKLFLLFKHQSTKRAVYIIQYLQFIRKFLEDI